MNIRIDSQTDRQTDEIHKHHVYVGLSQGSAQLVISYLGKINVAS